MTSLVSAESTLKITDLTGNTTTVTYGELLAMPKTTENAGLYCYGLLVTEGDWGGVKLSDLLTQTNVDPAVSSINFQAQDGYSITIPIDKAMQPDTIIAYEKDGVPLTENLRLVIPEANGNFWVAQIITINMTSFQANENLSGNFVRTNPHATPTPQSTPTPTQPTPTPTSHPTVEPSATPTNTTPLNQQQNITKQNSTPQKQGLAIEATYGIVIAVVAVAGVGFVAYTKRKR
jgi:DMSO/TMAO reductase YedYZ molybdopterin-dependent catalytic subunit